MSNGKLTLKGELTDSAIAAIAAFIISTDTKKTDHGERTPWPAGVSDGRIASTSAASDLKNESNQTI